MSIRRNALALTTVAAVAAGSTALIAAPAQADGPERKARGSIAGAPYSIHADKERSRYYVDADIDGAPAGSQWRMTVRHDGRVIGSQVARSISDDEDTEVNFRKVWSRNTAGKDTFRVTLQRVGGGAATTRTLVFQR